MQTTTSTPEPISTTAVLLETSVGALVVDLFGCDCPALTANFVNLCRCKLWSGAVATEVVPDVVVFFSHAADPTYDVELMRPTHETAARPAPSSEGGSPIVSPGLANSFWHLAALHTGPASPHTQEHRRCERTVAAAAQAEFTLSKRRVLTTQTGSSGGVTVSAAPVSKDRAAGALGRRGLLIVEAVPSSETGSSSGTATVDSTRPSSFSYRFGLTLSDRSMDYLEGRYVAIGAVREGITVLDRIRRAPHGVPPSLPSPPGTVTVSRYVQDCPPWPRPLRMLRVKHATVLPTPGTEVFLRPGGARPAAPATVGGTGAAPGNAMAAIAERRRRLSRMLTEAGCFQYWAPQAAVVAAAQHIAAAVRRTSDAYAATAAAAVEGGVAVVGSDSAVASPTDTATAAVKACRQPLVVLPASASTDASADEVISVEYNAHATGDYLSSDEDGGVGGGGGDGARQVLRRQELETRREAAKQLHQSKANETLSLMLNVLNGVADVSGDLQPPENVLFVCKLNPATTGEGLAMCFRQFGQVLSAEVVKDRKTGHSLCYGFVELESPDACYRAFQKMDRALVDDCRIHVDFSQSVSKLWFARRQEMRKRVRE